MIKQQCIEDILSAADIVDVVGAFIQLKKSGSGYSGKSPFVEEKTPSFMVSPSKQIFKCFSSGNGGGPVKFLMLKGYTFPDAIRWLGDRYNITIEFEDQDIADKPKAKAREQIMEVNEVALQWFSSNLAEVLDSVSDRFTPDDILQWEIGYSPDDWKGLVNEVNAKGLTQPAMEAGLISEKNGNLYDFFRGRLIFPIRSNIGKVIAFGGRIMVQPEDGKKVAKYTNSRESEAFIKGNTFYGMQFARDAIRKSGKAFLVEGYTDVIAMHRAGFTNTVATLGTALTEWHVKEIARHTKKVVLVRDSDSAGFKAALRDTTLLNKHGIGVQMVSLPEGEDPESWLNITSVDNAAEHLAHAEDAIIFFARWKMEAAGQDKTLRDEAADFAAGMVLDMPSQFLREEYTRDIIKTLGLSRKQFDGKLKEVESARHSAATRQGHKAQMGEEYELPHGVTCKLEDVIDSIKKYGLFMSNDQMWFNGENTPFFYSASNFTIEVIQHMQDEKLPMKLVKIRNIHGDERIFDVPSQYLNTPGGFDNAMTDQGNFLWQGSQKDFHRLRAYLFDNMGVGQKIEVLGWQTEGFWVWNNAITKPGQGVFDIEETGIYKTDKRNWYIPSANRIYASNDFKFTPQKKVKLLRSEVSLQAITNQMVNVHREHAYTGILFTIASMFLDIVEDKLGNFPLLFLYGPPNSGKDQLIDCCQSFFGMPQSPIHIGNKVSTQKAQIRKFAQFRNMMVHLSEYRPGDKQLDELLKGFWDRRGYERGTIESQYGTEVVPILSSVIFTGNHYPDDDALITRMITEEMVRNDFTQEEKNEYRKLKDMYPKGISYITADLLNHRQRWEDSFKEVFRTVETELKSVLSLAGNERMISNVSVLGACYHLMKDTVLFPFSWNDLVEHFKTSMAKQVRKLNTASVLMKWWDCFLAAVRTKNDGLHHGREFKLENNELVFNFSHCYNRVAGQWWSQYHEQAPTKSKIIDILKKDDAYSGNKDSVRMGQSRTSAMVVNAKELPIFEDLQQAVAWQSMDGIDVRPTPPVHPDQYHEPAPASSGDDELPF